MLSCCWLTDWTNHRGFRVEKEPGHTCSDQSFLTVLMNFWPMNTLPLTTNPIPSPRINNWSAGISGILPHELLDCESEDVFMCLHWDDVISDLLGWVTVLLAFLVADIWCHSTNKVLKVGTDSHMQSSFRLLDATSIAFTGTLNCALWIYLSMILKYELMTTTKGTADP